MKKYFLISLLLYTGIVLTSCSKDVGVDNNVITNNSVTNSFVSGNWKISYVTKDRQDVTREFMTFRFTFYSNKTLLAENDLLTANGSWALRDSENAKTEMVLAFNSPEFFTKLNNEWVVVEKTNNTIRLESTIGGNADVLMFQRL